MKRKPSTLHRRLPIDFGEELLSPVPVQNSAISFGDSGRNSALVDSIFNLQLSTFSNGCGRGLRFGSSLVTCQSLLRRRRAFTLVELLVVLALLSLITFALMAVFSTTQRAFRAGLTQTDSLEGGRAVMDLIAGDLETLTPSYDVSNYFLNGRAIITSNAVNFSELVNPNFAFPPSPLVQSLVGSSSGALRTNLLENIFILGKGNLNGVPSWIATGYYVTNALADGTLYPLYRFYMTTNATSGARGANGLYVAFTGLNVTNNAIWSHLMDGVVNLTVHAFDTNGVWITNGYYGPVVNPVNIASQNVACFGTTYGEMNCLFFSNSVPASVQVTLGTMEDRTLTHAEGLSGMNQSNFLANSAAQVHLFTRRVWIRNVDPTAYQ